MEVAQIVKFAKVVKMFVRNYSAAMQWVALGTATAGMWGGIFLVVC